MKHFQKISVFAIADNNRCKPVDTTVFINVHGINFIERHNHYSVIGLDCGKHYHMFNEDADALVSTLEELET